MLIVPIIRVDRGRIFFQLKMFFMSILNFIYSRIEPMPPHLTRHMESAYEQMHERVQQGLGPQGFEVGVDDGA
jgi:hypothetical protein